jgi:hypothetical protein
MGFNSEFKELKCSNTEQNLTVALCVCVCMWVCARARAPVRVCVRACLCVCVCVCVCVWGYQLNHTQTHIYTHSHRQDALFRYCFQIFYVFNIITIAKQTVYALILYRNEHNDSCDHVTQIITRIKASKRVKLIKYCTEKRRGRTVVQSIFY